MSDEAAQNVSDFNGQNLKFGKLVSGNIANQVAKFYLGSEFAQRSMCNLCEVTKLIVAAPTLALDEVRRN